MCYYDVLCGRDFHLFLDREMDINTQEKNTRYALENFPLSIKLNTVLHTHTRAGVLPSSALLLCALFFYCIIIIVVIIFVV